jgi:acyl-coenzyme A thioesterase PaaI-like protein
VRAPTDPPASATIPPRHPEAPAPGEPIASHYHLCFGCGVDHPTGLHLQITAGEGLTISARFTVTGDHQGAPGLAHGGVLTAAFDEALSGINWLLRTPSVTARLETDFRRPVPVGSTLYINAECVGVERRKIYTRAQGRLDAPDGPLAVTAAAIFVMVGMDHFRAHGRSEDLEHAATRSEVLENVGTLAPDFEVNP